MARALLDNSSVPSSLQEAHEKLIIFKNIIDIWIAFEDVPVSLAESNRSKKDISNEYDAEKAETLATLVRETLPIANPEEEELGFSVEGSQ